MRPCLATFMLLATLLGAARPCGGWGATPEERMACCQDGLCPMGMHHGHGLMPLTQDVANSCCAASEQREQQQQSRSPQAPILIAPDMATVTVVPPVSVPKNDARVEHVEAASRSAPLHLLFSVFLV